MNTWHIFVFSYNRGIYLQNCLDSIKKCNLTIDVTIIDDNSDDEETVNILNALNSTEGFTVVKPSVQENLEKRLGGLYGNMNLAIEIAKKEQKEHVIFIQDDMQFVRKINTDDLTKIELIFEQNQDIQQIQSCFLRRLAKARIKSHLTSVDNGSHLVWDSGSGPHSNFAAVGIYYVPRLTKIHGPFIAGERANNKVAIQNSIKLAQLYQPFMMWLPYSTSYTRKNTKYSTILIEKLANCGFYPINIMSDSTYQRMLENKDNTLPLAEDWLEVPKLSNKIEWSFSAGVINLFARGGFRRVIAKLLWKL